MYCVSAHLRTPTKFCCYLGIYFPNKKGQSLQYRNAKSGSLYNDVFHYLFLKVFIKARDQLLLAQQQFLLQRRNIGIDG